MLLLASRLQSEVQGPALQPRLLDVTVVAQERHDVEVERARDAKSTSRDENRKS